MSQLQEISDKPIKTLEETLSYKSRLQEIAEKQPEYTLQRIFGDTPRQTFYRFLE